MSLPEYLNLRRQFLEVEASELDEAFGGGKPVGWEGILSRRAAVIRAPANFGKTTEMQERAKRLRGEGKRAVFVALRRVRTRRDLRAALLESSEDLESFEEWAAAPSSALTVFLDSLDEASPQDAGDLAYSLALVTKAVSWPAADVRWVISTRPALLTPSVVDQLRHTFSRGRTLTTTSAAPKSPRETALNAAFSERVVDPEVLAVFRMTPLDRGQAIRYMGERLKISQASEVLATASRMGLGSLASNPGGLSMLKDVDILNRPPNSLTEVMQRLEDVVWDRLGRDQHFQDAGNSSMDAIKSTVRRLAAASQVCQQPNLELPQDGLLFTPDALSARLISRGRISEAVLQALMGSHGFIDVGQHQVKVFPDELPPYMAARYFSDLVQSPAMAHDFVSALSWEAPTGEHGVDKRLLPLMGWLATLNPHCRAEILRKDPQCLAFFGDLRNPNVATGDAERALRSSLANIVERDDWPGRGAFRLTSENYWQAGPARLEVAIADLFRQYGNEARGRDVLLNIAAFARSEVLRSRVLADCGGKYEKLLEKSMDVDYILELGREDDLTGLATAMLAVPGFPESVCARIVEKLGWGRLKPRDVLSMLDRYFGRGNRAYQLTFEISQGLVPAASTEQLRELARGLVLRASATREKPGRRAPRLHTANERFLEFSAEILASLMRREDADDADELAILSLILVRVIRDSLHGTADLDELKQALKERMDVRRAYLGHLARLAAANGDDLWQYLYGYGALCPPEAGDMQALNLERLTRAVLEQAKFAENAVRERPAPVVRNRLELSSQSKRELEAILISGNKHASALTAIAWVANWLQQTNAKSRYGEVDFTKFERSAGKQLAQVVREGFARVWRMEPPAYREDQPNSTFHITAAGLQGLHFELGDGKQLPNLTKDEVRQAIRYGVFEINGYPEWFWNLVCIHEVIAGDELESVAKSGSAGAVSRNHAENLFAALDQAPKSIQKRLAPVAWQVLEADTANSREFVVKKMLQATKAIPEVTSQAEFEHLAWQRISSPFLAPSQEIVADAAASAAASRNAIGQATAWSSHWLARYPRNFVERMLQWVADDANSAKALLYALAAELGAERGSLLRSIATSTHDGVDSLGVLYLLMLDVVKRTEDLLHADEDAYMLGQRDRAQELRDLLVPSIAEAGTQRAYDVLQWLKLKLGGDRVASLSRFQYDLQEAKLTRPPIDQRDFERFESAFEAGLANSVSFNLAVQNALLAVKYDIENGEHSLRRFFSAVSLNAVKTDTQGLALESDFQQLLASELKHHARNQFSVLRETETAERNRRDVHCTKEVLDLSASIELKMSERWTLPHYVAALEKQLVGQYMRNRNAKTGFLVIVLQRARKWEVPGARTKLSFDELVTTLQERANVLMRSDASLFLRVIGINAVEPTNFRKAGAK